ncbi:MAG: hypothetical protein CMK56_03945 [Proteobacteria bacterium]|nr:hypothetical protein [Pseudomonadota bacterium]
MNFKNDLLELDSIKVQLDKRNKKLRFIDHISLMKDKLWLKYFFVSLFNFKRNQEVKKILQEIKFEKRVKDIKNVRKCLDSFSFRLGGESAQKKISKITNKVNNVNFKNVLKSILKQTSNDPILIINWVKQHIIHVDDSPCVIDNRPFNAIETLISGLGQCTNSAILAGSLMQSAGFEVRYWSTKHHTFLEWWNSKTKSWQLEDSNSFPPGVNLPRGLSLSQLYSCNFLWRKIFQTLPTGNVFSQFSIFAPEKNYGLSLLENNINKPNRFFNINIPVKIDKSFKISKRTIEVNYLLKGKKNFLKISNSKKKKVLLIVINKEYPEKGIYENKSFIIHNIFAYKCLPNYLNDIEDSTLQKNFFIIRENEKTTKKLNFINSSVISVLVKDYDNTFSNPYHLSSFKIDKNKRLEKVIKKPSKKYQEIELAYKKNYKKNIYPKAISYSKYLKPNNCMEELKLFGLKNIKGNVLDAGCGTGEYSILMSKFVNKIESVDYTEERIKLFKDVIKNLNFKYIKKINISQMSIEKTNFPNDYFDTILCKGVIWQTNLKKTFNEFFRILKKNGRIIFDFNTDAWNHYLMRNSNDKNKFRIGAETLYNSIWRRYSSISLKYYKKSIKKKDISYKNKLLIQTEMVRIENLIKIRNQLLEHLSYSEVDKATKLELYILLNCGQSYLFKILKDIFLNLLGFTSGPSTSMSSESFEPNEIRELAHNAGFSKFKYWIKNKNKKLSNDFDSNNSSYFSLQFLGKVKTWNAILSK